MNENTFYRVLSFKLELRNSKPVFNMSTAFLPYRNLGTIGPIFDANTHHKNRCGRLGPIGKIM